jgi:hypothetical protein
MTVANLRARIEREASASLLPVLLDRAAEAHRNHWRDCDCSWCQLKQQATVRIGNVRCGDREERADIRFHMANEYRAKLKAAYLDGQVVQERNAK